MPYPEDAGNITPLIDGTDYVEAANVNNVVTELSNVKTLVGIPGAAQSHLATLLDMLADNYSGGRCYGEDGTTDEVYVGAFSGIISNAAGSIRKLRRITSVTTLTAADLDTGAMAVGYYYIYATADAAASTPVFKFSASDTTPTGYTYYKKIGWFYNETASVLDVTSLFIGNIRDGSANPNQVKVTSSTEISTTSDSYVDMTNMEIKFVANGGPVKIDFSGAFNASGVASTGFTIEIDASVISISENGTYSDNRAPGYLYNGSTIYEDALTAGEHTIKVQWKRTATMYTHYNQRRILIVEEK